MKYLDFYNKLDSMKNKEYIENFLVYNMSLVIAGVKPAVTITIKKNNKKIYDNWNKFGKDFIDNIKLKSIELRESDDSIILMIYDEEILKKEVLSKDNMKFLINLGYSSEAKIEDYIKYIKV